jgi:hypothetical protein
MRISLRNLSDYHSPKHTILQSSKVHHNVQYKTHLLSGLEVLPLYSNHPVHPRQSITYRPNPASIPLLIIPQPPQPHPSLSLSIRILYTLRPTNSQPLPKHFQLFFTMEPPKLPRTVFAHKTVDYSDTTRVLRNEVCAVVNYVVDNEPEFVVR